MQREEWKDFPVVENVQTDDKKKKNKMMFALINYSSCDLEPLSELLLQNIHQNLLTNQNEEFTSTVM